MNMKTRHIIPFILTLLLAAACNKVELPPPVGEAPIFSLDLNWTNGSSLQLTAGEDRYYLFTGFEADSLDVFEFYGRFEQIDCLDQCDPAFAIYFRDEQVTNTGFPGFPAFLQDGEEYDYRAPASVSYDTLYQHLVQFQSTSNTGGVFYPQLWTINDTISFLSLDPLFVWEEEIPFKACLEIGDPAQGAYSRQCQTVQLDSLPGFSVTINADSNAVLLSANPLGGQPPYSYSWNTGATTPSIQNVQPGSTYCVDVTDALGVESSSCVLVSLNPAVQSIVASFDYQSSLQITTVPVPGDTLQLEKVILEYTADGLVFRSDRQPQPPGAYFIIDEVRPYQTNENGFPTMLIRARFSGVLYSENGGVLAVEAASVQFAIAFND
jgi:hypothetical protein